MKLRLRQLKVLDKHSPFDNQVVDIYIINGVIADIQIAGYNTEETDFEDIDLTGYFVSPGWIDLRARSGEPGYEQRETLNTLCYAAAKGGYTAVCVLPETSPAIQTKASLAFFINYRHCTGVELKPIAGVTHNLQGEKLNDLLDLHYHGAVAFSDGNHGIQHADIMLKTLQYLKTTGKRLFQRPLLEELASFAHMHEGLASTRMGVKGFPQMSEYIQVQRDLHLLQYTGGSLHISGISTIKSMEFIADAKSKGLNVTCDVAVHQLCFTEDDLETFDQNLKVNPPLRTEATRKGLIQGIINGTVDAIVSDHTPLEPELKQIEFDKAEFGISGIETVFKALCTYTPELSIELIAKLLAHRPMKILGLTPHIIDIGNAIPLTIFTNQGTSSENIKSRASRSHNSPYIGKELRGGVYGIFTPKNGLYKNQ
jgi:dihydroorotase